MDKQVQGKKSFGAKTLKGKECKHAMQYRRQYTVNYFLQQHSTCPKSIFNVNFGHNLEVHAY